MEGARPRWVLHMQAQMWRYLMSIGMFLHKCARPRPPKPSFVRTIKSTVSATEGSFNLSFYVPQDYEQQRNKPRRGKGYPCVINFHGGGFTLGTSTDDGRWCGTVVEQCDAIVVSVDYRRAPECPFPTAVEDGVDAIIYCARHAEELGINPAKMALSGFSSGGNMSFTVPLRLYDHLTNFGRSMTREESGGGSADDMDESASLLPVPTNPGSLLNVPTDSSGMARPPLLGQMATNASTTSVNRILRSRSAMNVPHAEENLIKQAKATANECPDVSLCAIVPWYPSIDYTQTRAQRRSTLIRKDQDLPSLFTDLFDQSYLHPPDTIPLDSPYLSPGIAETALLREALPQDIIMHTCEWDMLLDEGVKFKERLISPEINKKVDYTMVEGVPHGWDKAPNPIKPTPGVKEHYLHACDELRRVFHEVDKKSKNKFGAGVNGARDRASSGASSVIGESGEEGSSEDSIQGLARGKRRESRLVR